MRISIFLSLLLMLPTAAALAQSNVVIKHYQHQERYVFGQDLLKLAMGKLEKPYKILAPDQQYVNEKRGEMQIIEGRLDLEWMSTTSERELSMIPVRIPIYRGLHGLRLVLVKPQDAERIGALRALADLRLLRGGHGAHWGDLPVYEANGLPVHTHARYNTLFKQLIGGKFDYFHRGVNEIWAEQERHADALEIAPGIMLYYPHPVYFFVSRKRPGLAEMIETGLRRALADGSYQALFMRHFRGYLDKARLDERHLIVLRNPVVPDGADRIDTSWWLPARHGSALETALFGQ